ncbi:hypothetical protein [Nocardia tengchongensis]|uniref:hypothetical protein n=1 Tax=Nocardia tengchongensis TaxID=2055889 RepID=UPI0036518A38
MAPPTEEWGLVVGDILTNLRHSLDHALFGHITARHPNLTERERQKIQYPAVKEPTKWREQEKRYADPTDPWVAAPVWAVIEANQPFHIPDPSLHQLYLLSKLAGQDKHRTLHVVVHRAAATLHAGRTHITELPATAQPLTDGAVLVRERILRPLPSAGPAVLKDRGETAYIEHLDIPTATGSVRRSVLELMEDFTNAVGLHLDSLSSAGC